MGIAALWALPWLIAPIVIFWRLRDSVHLDAYPAGTTASFPMVSVIVPARDEARNVEACVRSIVASRYPTFEVIVVNDHSRDGTGDIARRIAAEDARVSVIENPRLADGWFGKQWACHNGARTARGELLLFTDADTRHGPECLARSVNALAARNADLLSVVGTQEMDTFWERLVQPHIFLLLLGVFGGTEIISRATSPYRKIANGQYMLMRRAVYDAAGGHEAVRTHVAEDLRLAQEWCRRGLRVHMVVGIGRLSTRMYVGLGEIVRGWGKNAWAAGRDTVPLSGPVAQGAFRVVFPAPPLWEIVPAIVAVAALFGAVSPAAGAWGAMAYALSTLSWAVIYAAIGQPLWYALLNPLASMTTFAILARAAWKGSKVEWKGREYRSQ
jgi:chlorobactene glucosyltransferase